MKPSRTNYPAEVYRRAHAAYPAEVGRWNLYGVAFFGHAAAGKLPKTHKGRDDWALFRHALEDLES